MLSTGYHLLSLMYGDVTYVSRSEYSSREAMLQRHAARIKAEATPEAKVISRCFSIGDLTACSLDSEEPFTLSHKHDRPQASPEPDQQDSGPSHSFLHAIAQGV